MIKTFQTNDGIDEHKFGYQRVIRHCFTHISTFQETHNYKISYLGFVRRLKLIRKRYPVVFPLQLSSEAI